MESRPAGSVALAMLSSTHAQSARTYESSGPAERLERDLDADEILARAGSHMTFVTLGEARLAASARGITAAAAPTELRKAAAAPISTQYHFFLSHTREDAAVIAGVKTLLEGEGWKVY